MSAKPLMLVDGTAYLFRAFHAMPPLSNAQGEPTGAVVGVIQMLNQLLLQHQPERLAMVFDARGSSFRHDLYPEYKAQRKATPEDLIAQIAPLHEAVQALGLPLLSVSGVEADDVIATLALQADAAGWPVLIASGDKDLAQLVNARIHVLDSFKNHLLDEAGVLEKFGVPAQCLGDFLALVGDKADNVPGVPGFGEKSSAKWLQVYGGLDHLLEHASEIPGKLGAALMAHVGQLRLSRQLIQLKTDVALEVTLDDLRIQAPDYPRLRQLYVRLGSRKLLASLPRDLPDAPPTGLPEATAQYHTLLDPQDFLSWVDRLRHSELLCVDTETTGLDYMQAELVGLSFAIHPGEAVYIPVAHSYLGAPAQLTRDWVLEQLKPLLENPAIGKIGQHIKFDMNILARYGIKLRGVRFDTMLESYLLDSGATHHNMDALAARHLGFQTIKFEDIAGKGIKQLTFDQIPLEQAAPYAAEDAEVTLRLHQRLWPRLAAIPALEQLARELEFPLISVLSEIERTGVKIDPGLLAIQSQELAMRLIELEQEAYKEVGHAFNLSSPKQIGAILFDEMHLPVLERTPKGAPSTSEAVLQDMADQGLSLPGLILEHRGLAKLKSTYTDKLRELMRPSGRVHTSYHQAVAATGRLSSSDPNLQNIPIRTEEGRRIRRAFIAEPGWRILAADYSQIELRILAHYSGDPGLLRAFTEGLDVHRATAGEVLGIPFEQVNQEQRRSAKAINFGLIYGMSAFGLARQLGVDRRSAQDYIDRYFARYPGVQGFMEATREQARQQGYVETLSGRRLYVRDINASNANQRAAAERAAINAPMQGTAADIIKRAMLSIADWIHRDQVQARMIMQVHDELVFEVRDDWMERVRDQVRRHMEEAQKLRVPLLVSLGEGTNWEEAH